MGKSDKVKGFKEFWKATPPNVDRAIAIGVGAICIGLGFSLGRSTKVVFDGDGVRIEQQAIASQKDLEYSLFLIRAQQGVINRYQQDAIKFSRQHKEGQELAEQAQFAAGFIPERQIQQLEERVVESREVLEEAL